MPAELVSQIPAHAEHDDLLVKVPALEESVHFRLRSSALSFDRFANDYAVSKQFAPEPSRRRSLAGRAGAHPCSTPYSVEQADPGPRPRHDVGIKRGTAFWRIGTFRTPSGSNVLARFLSGWCARSFAPRGDSRGAIGRPIPDVARPAGAQPVRRINLYVKLTAPHSKRKFLARMLVLQQAF